MPDYCGFYSLKQMADVNKRFDWIVSAIREHHPGIILIDGIGDLVHDPNDLGQATTVIQGLMAVADECGTCVLTTIHGNPKVGTDKRDEKARGHLGSELMRKAESVLMIQSSGTSDIRTLTSAFMHGKNRSGGTVSSSFRWDDGKKMMVTCEDALDNTKPVKVNKYEAMASRLRETKAYPWAWTELRDAVLGIQGKTPRAAEYAIEKMVDYGQVTQYGEVWCVGERPPPSLYN